MSIYICSLTNDIAKNFSRIAEGEVKSHEGDSTYFSDKEKGRFIILFNY